MKNERGEVVTGVLVVTMAVMMVFGMFFMHGGHGGRGWHRGHCTVNDNEQIQHSNRDQRQMNAVAAEKDSALAENGK